MPAELRTSNTIASTLIANVQNRNSRLRIVAHDRWSLPESVILTLLADTNEIGHTICRIHEADSGAVANPEKADTGRVAFATTPYVLHFDAKIEYDIPQVHRHADRYDPEVSR